MALGDKSLARIPPLVVLDVEADAHDVLLVAQESVGLFLRSCLQGGGEFEMQGAHDDAGIGGRVLLRVGHDDGVRPSAG